MHLAIIADTHLPKGTRRLPDACVERLRAADLIVHAGDFSRIQTLRELESYSQVIGVQGNVDDHEIRAALPETAQIGLQGLTIAIIHDAGPATSRADRLRKRFPNADAVIFGHSHLPLHQTAAGGFQIFNPGSPTERRRAPHHTMGIATVRRGAVGFQLIELD